MNDYFTIDIHTHTQDDMKELSMFCDCMGTPEELLSIMKGQGIDAAVVATVSPLPGSAGGLVPDIIHRNAQNCLLAQKHEELFAFMTLHPKMGKEVMITELRDKVEHFDARGIKLHPDVGCFPPNDESLWPVYEMAENRGLPILSHGGGSPLMNTDYTRPCNFERVLQDFPDLTLIVAHMGIYSNFEKYKAEALQIAERFSNVCFDISGVISDGIIELVRKVGTHRVMFGSDYPYHNSGDELRRFLDLRFTESEKTAILGENAKRILKL